MSYLKSLERKTTKTKNNNIAIRSSCPWLKTWQKIIEESSSNQFKKKKKRKEKTIVKMKEKKFLPKNPCDVIIFVDTIKIVSKFVVTLRTLLESCLAEDESEWAREAHGKL